ncbi:MAG: hypothetical protein Q7T82_21535 [Armatimonadota bacterium]|nr:hypothetical protein [Armatimonadota bacterium]
MKVIIAAFVLALILVSSASADTPAAMEANRALKYISDYIISGKAQKPITRAVLSPTGQTPDLQFVRQSDLTSDLVDRYLSRGISHFLPWDKPQRSREFLRNTGTKYVHWSHLLWGPPPPDWKTLSAEIDTVHNSEWGKDVVFEAGVMEAIYKDTIDKVTIPEWLFQCMEDLGINKTRKPGPSGPKCFSYENMFDRNAADWNGMVGRWAARGKDGSGEASVPDITMTETQLWYAYLITEYIDAGFEGIFFGQFGLTGSRDKGNECMWEFSQFTKRLAAARAYRRSVFLSTHHYCVAYKGQLNPDSPTMFTHMTWPSRMFYSSKHEFGMECGLNATEDGKHRTRAEFKMLMKPPFDLPMLIEIDNYGKVSPDSPIAADSEGNDEITAYMKKPPAARAAFLRYYYHEFQTYKNKPGKCRTHLAPSGERCGYMPYAEQSGEEETIADLFREAAKLSVMAAAIAKDLQAAEAAEEWKTYRDGKRNFALERPGASVLKDRSAELTRKTPGSFWLEFSVRTNNKTAYAINVRRAVLAADTTPETYAAENPFLLTWERVTINGVSGFSATTGEQSAKTVIHRALLVDGKSVWMLNLTDTSGGNPQKTKQVFERVARSLNVKGLEPVDASD